VSWTVHVPYTIEQDEDGVWCASAQLRPSVGAVGEAATKEAAVADLAEALAALIAETGAPPEVTLTLNVAWWRASRQSRVTRLSRPWSGRASQSSGFPAVIT